MRLFKFAMGIVFIAISIPACTAPESSVCDNGSYCPASRVCMVGGGCEDRASFVACLSLRDSDPCSTSTLPAGVCRDRLCVSSNCGDYFVNPGEGCDDGNVIGGDGCSANCDKFEVCGDAIVDEGESCDDGNLNSVDGCDACVATRWSVTTRISGIDGNVLADPHDVTFDDDGNMFVADTDHHRVRRIDAETGIVTTVAGNGAQGFSGDGGPATSASFNEPRAVFVDGLGNLFITDNRNARVRQVDAQSGIVTTVVGNGNFVFSGDGGAAISAGTDPESVVVDGLGNIFIADQSQHRVRRVDAQSGIITTVAGNGTSGHDGDGGNAKFAKLSGPSGLFMDDDENLFIADTYSNYIRRVDGLTGIITTVAGNGAQGYSGDNILAVATSLHFPSRVAVDNEGNLFIADTYANRIRRVDAQSGIITTVAGSTQGYSGDGGDATSARLNYPTGFFINALGDLFIADSRNNRIRLVDGKSEIITTAAGNGNRVASGDGGAAMSAPLRFPSGVVVDETGDIYIADNDNHRIRRVSSLTGAITTVVGNGVPTFRGDGGAATDASIRSPKSVYIDNQGNLFIADTSNHRVRRVDSQSGIITTVAGTGSQTYSGDGGLATDAALNFPVGVFVDSQSNLFITESGNHRVRRVDGNSGIITTVAGNGTSSYSGDGGAATDAAISYPRGLFVDNQGNVFFSDSNNHRVRRIDSQSGIITTVAGSGAVGNQNGSLSGDGGPATDATLDTPYGLFIDALGNLFISDSENQRVRRVDADSGVITTIAGNSVALGFYGGGFSGDGGLAIDAELKVPLGIFVDVQGNVFIAERHNNCIRRIDGQSGVITTVAGPIDPAGMGPAVSAKLSNPTAIAMSDNGLFITGGVSGTLQRYLNNAVEVVSGRYSHAMATANLARFRDSTFSTIGGVAVDSGQGTIYISQPERHSIEVITMTDVGAPETWTMSPLIGAGVNGFADGPIAGARFSSPTGLLPQDNLLYVADTGNHVVRVIDISTGTVSTIAGTPGERGFFGDTGPADAALLFSPSAFAICPNGDLFIADTGNHRIRRIEATSGVISTVLGDGVAASSGEGVPASSFPIHKPQGLSCDVFGNVFATSTNAVRLLPADVNGVVDGTGPVQSIYGESPRTLFPENVTRCLSGIVNLDDKRAQFADACTGMLIEIERVPESP